MIRRILYLFSLTVFLASLISIASLIYFIKYYYDDLPDHKQLESYNPPLTSRIYTLNGELMAEYFKENRIYLPFEHIPHNLINAFIAAEDQNYYSHPGIDYTSLIRAIAQNALNIGTNRSLVGGSTITQQVVKNFLLSNERTLARKIKEAILSFRITQVYSKQKILELYLNQIYLGNGAYGVATAALTYFNKAPKDLSLSEMAFIAGLPKAPSSYNPEKNYYRAKARRDYVINRMFEEKMIDETQAKSAMLDKILINKKSQNIPNFYQNYFSEYVRRSINEKFGNKDLNEGGLTVISTINTKFQRIAQECLSEALINYDQQYNHFRQPLANIDINQDIVTQLNRIKIPTPLNWQIAAITKIHPNKLLANLINNQKISLSLEENKWIKTNINNFNQLFKNGDVIFVVEKEGKYYIKQIPQVNGGILALEPFSGKILALSGGFDYRYSEFDRVSQAIRQPGSTIKSFVYLAGLELGINPNTIFEDAPIEISQGPGLPNWSPKNYKGDFLGNITFRTAFEKSRNTVTARIAQQVGMNKVAEVIKRSGINDNPSKNFATVLGSSETTLMKMVSAYSIFVNDGKMAKPYAIEQIYDNNGISIYRETQHYCPDCNNYDNGVPEIKTDYKQITDERTTYQMLSFLNGVMNRGTGQSSKRLNMHLFGKTGTSNDSKDIWFIGGNSNIVVGVFMGYDQPKDMGKRVTGASHALPCFINFMNQIKNNLDNEEFIVPNGIEFINIDVSSGNPSDLESDGRNIIKEVFKAGSEPFSSFKKDDGSNKEEIEDINESIY